MGNDVGNFMSGNLKQSCTMSKAGGMGVMYSRAVRGSGPGVRSPGLKSQLQLLFIWPSYLAFIDLSLCICEVGIIMALNRITVRIKLDITDVEHLAQ